MGRRPLQLREQRLADRLGVGNLPLSAVGCPAWSAVALRCPPQERGEPHASQNAICIRNTSASDWRPGWARERHGIQLHDISTGLGSVKAFGNNRKHGAKVVQNSEPDDLPGFGRAGPPIPTCNRFHLNPNLDGPFPGALLAVTPKRRRHPPCLTASSSFRHADNCAIWESHSCTTRTATEEWR